MKKRRNQLIFLFVLVWLLLPFSVWAEPNTITYSTTIQNWKPNNHLSIIASNDFPSGVTSSWVLDCDGVDVPLTKQSGYVFANVSNTCDDAVFKETVSFTGMTPTNLGLNTLTMTPATFDRSASENASLSTRVQTYMFSSLPVPNVPVYYFVLNTVDNDGNIIGNPYIRDIYFSDDDEKTTEMDLGMINLPNYELSLSFVLKGNIANPNGNFYLTYDQAMNHQDQELAYRNLNGPVVLEDLTLSQLYGFYDDYSDYIEFGYGLDEPSQDYEISVDNNTAGANDFDTSLVLDGNTFSLDYVVSAMAQVDGSDTGLFYNIWPFIIILLVGVGAFFLFFFRHKKKKSKVIIDQEII